MTQTELALVDLETVKELARQAEEAKRKYTKALAALKAQTARRFDRLGVSYFLKTRSQQKAFREVLDKTAKQVPFDAQAKLAALLLDLANKHNNGNPAADFIKLYLPEMTQWDLRKGGDLDHQLSADAVRNIERKHADKQFNTLQKRFCRRWNGIGRDLSEMNKLKKQYPDIPFTVLPEMKMTMKYVIPAIETLKALFR